MAPSSLAAMTVSGSELVSGIERTLARLGIDYDGVIASFGQVRASEERESGRIFSLREHVRGLVFAQLSNQRSWKPIAENRDRITDLFFEFDPDKLAAAS